MRFQITWIVAALTFAGSSLLPVNGTAQTNEASPVRREFHDRHMGVDVLIVIYGGTEVVANDAARQAFLRIAELDRVFSDYNSDSEAMRLCREASTGQPIPVSNDLWSVLKTAQQLSKRSHGSFDVTIGPVSKLWRRSRRRRELPPADLLKAARDRVGWRLIEVDASRPFITLSRSDLQLDFGGIVKGYAAESALRVLRKRGLSQSLVGLEGDIAVGEAPPGSTGWRIGIAPLDHPERVPSRWVQLTNASISTSGDVFQFVEIGGIRYSHIVDPRTGLGLRRRSSVTVIAPHGATADGLATTASILGPEAGLKFIREHEAEALFMTADNDKKETHETSGFHKYLAPD